MAEPLSVKLLLFVIEIGVAIRTSPLACKRLARQTRVYRSINDRRSIHLAGWVCTEIGHNVFIDPVSRWNTSRNTDVALLGSRAAIRNNFGNNINCAKTKPNEKCNSASVQTLLVTIQVNIGFTEEEFRLLLIRSHPVSLLRGR